MGQDEFYGEQYGHTQSSSEPLNQQYYPDGNHAHHFFLTVGKYRKNLTLVTISTQCVCVHTVPFGVPKFQISERFNSVLRKEDKFPHRYLFVHSF